jgi:hypothetical protein
MGQRWKLQLVRREIKEQRFARNWFEIWREMGDVGLLCVQWFIIVNIKPVLQWLEGKISLVIFHP